MPEAGAAVDEERVVRLRGRFGDGERRSVGEAVRRADHEEIERVLRVELDLGRLAALKLLLDDLALSGRERVPRTPEAAPPASPARAR